MMKSKHKILTQQTKRNNVCCTKVGRKYDIKQYENQNSS